MTVACFGHKDTPSDIKPRLEQEIVHLIEENEDITILVGTHGSFDGMVQKMLKNLAPRYPNMNYHIVLAYLPVKREENNFEGLPTMLPEGIENVPKKLAISYRNDFMVRECDAVICYITHDWGGAARFVEKARRQGKRIINL
ncbi:MAG: hypothetical protein HDT42_05600 [Ruminococcaceae bacterium]|nr:hypothetical protein [Oscillospiraceae bacterium]